MKSRVFLSLSLVLSLFFIIGCSSGSKQADSTRSASSANAGSGSTESTSANSSAGLNASSKDGVIGSVANGSNTDVSGSTQTINYSNGDIYEGQVKDGKADGYGTLTFKGGTIYVGEFKDDLREGMGAMILSNGDTFEGEFAYDHVVSGTYTWKNDPSFKSYSGGYDENGELDGIGTFTDHKGNVFVAEVSKGTINGLMTATWADSSLYTGMRADGIGTGIDTNGDQYCGTFLDGYINGLATYKWADGSIYSGEWSNSSGNGFGTVRWPDGSIYTGEWKGGKYEGKGMLIHSDGKTIEKGTWQQGVLVGK